MRARRGFALLFGVTTSLSTARASAAQAFALARYPASTRDAGLGGAGAALVGDADALFANPAGIATIRHLAVAASYEPISGRTAFSSAALALRVGRLELGGGAQTFGAAGKIASSDLLAATSLVYRRGLIALGVGGTYARAAGDSAGVWRGDVGLAVAVFDILALGASVQQIGGSALLPRRVRAGFTMNYTDPQGSYRLLSTLEGDWVAGAAAAVHAGIEAGFAVGGVGLVARAGYASRGPLAGASRLTFGAGVNFGRVRLDYAYQDWNGPTAGRSRAGVRWML
ncbi:MAG TPA: hypothetical protein VI160_06345 [Gemmatimonadales bacterium]